MHQQEAAEGSQPRAAGEPEAADGARPGAAGEAPPRRRRESSRARERRQRQAEEADTPLHRLKLEGVRALGLWDKVQAVGWGGLSAAESGRVGGYMTRMLRLERAEAATPGAPPAVAPRL